MRALLPAVAALLMGCATVVRDVPPGAVPSSGPMVAGRLAFSGSALSRALLFEDAAGREYSLRPEGETFAAPLPAGRYTLLSAGGYRPKHDRPTLDVAPEGASYLGTLRPARSEDGDLLLVVKDERGAVESDLHARYGASFPPLRPALLASSLEPAPGASGETVIALERPPPPPPSWHSYEVWWFYRLPCRPYRVRTR